jgi:signal transduction histidine kinase
MRGLGLLRVQLLVVFPLLLAASAVVAWRVIGASLRPVEHLRRGAEEITGAGPAAAARLPVPAGDDEIHRLAVTLNGMLDRLERGRARQREFVADAAHELRSPLANMRTQLEVSRRLGPDADWTAVSDDLLTDTTRLSRLVDDLLLLARADGAPARSRMEPVELQSLADEVVRRGHEAGDPGRCPQVEVIGDGPVWTVGAPDELHRVVANLLDNAERHARTGVAVATTRDGDAALLTVTDDGPGIPPEHRDRVFERFTRLDDSRAVHTGGAGLGLAIVRELVRRHGGTVTLTDAEPDRPEEPGLRVEVRLPAVSPP